MTESRQDSVADISVVIPALNAASTIETCLDAVLAQQIDGQIDVTVAVGPSHDGTRDIAEKVARHDPRVRVIDNPTGHTPAGLNLAIQAGEAPFVARVDAQSIIPAGYLGRAIQTLERTGAANVGGIQRPVGEPGLQRVIAVGMMSPFGAGPARFRRDGYEGPTDTVYLGTFRREALAEVGGFDESLERNQDYELNNRLRGVGLVVWLDPALVVDYRPRTTYSQLASQYYQYGIWKRHVLVRDPRSLQPRQAVAPSFVIGLLISAVELVRGRARGVLVPFSYAAAALLVARSTRAALPRKLDRYRLAGVFATMHVAWGAGFLFGRRRRRN